jgi:hypothetical protein
MRRRIVWTTAMLAVLLVVPSVPASAAEFTVQQPDGDVTEPTPIEVKVERDFGAERLRQLRASLEKDGARLGEPVDLECRQGCEEFAPEAALFVLPGNGLFDPADGAPFGAEGPLANGAYTLKLELLKNSNFQEDETFEGELHLAVPPSAPADLAAELDDDGVALTWTKSPEPDVGRYRVERRDGDEWEKVTTTSSATYVDDPGEGTHTYRVIAERPDGRDGTLEAASSERDIEVPSHEEAARRGGNGAEDDDADRDGEDEGGNGGNGDDDGAGNNGGEAQESDTSQQSDSSRRSRSGGAAAPSTGSGRSGSIPGIGERDGDGYATELDYGAMGDGESADDVRVANPGGWRGTVDRMFDAERIAVPIAAGLVMTGMGLHLWRWLRVPLS